MNKKKRVLVVDDERFFADDAADEIRLAGFDVTVATSYTETILALEKHPYDVVTLDIMMPIGQDEDIDRSAAEFGRRTGLVLFDQIQQRWPRLKVVIVSVLGATDLRVRSLSNLGVTVLAKPVTVDELIDAVKCVAE